MTIDLEMPGGRYEFTPAKGISEQQMVDIKHMTDEFNAAAQGEEVPEQPKTDAKAAKPKAAKATESAPAPKKIDFDTFCENLGTDVANLSADLNDVKTLRDEYNAMKAALEEANNSAGVDPKVVEELEAKVAALTAENETLKGNYKKLKKAFDAAIGGDVE